MYKFCKTFSNDLLTKIKLSKTKLSKMMQPRRFLGRLLGPLPKTGLPLMKNVLKSLAKSVLIPLRLTTVASAAGADIIKKIFGSETTILKVQTKKWKTSWNKLNLLKILVY